MASTNTTPKRSDRRRGRPSATVRSEPPRKKLRYIPGGPGGGGRYVEDDGTERINYSAPRARPPRQHSTDRRTPARRTRSPNTTASRPRRDRPPPEPRYPSAFAAATAMTQGEGYKPREERGWEEFHPDLDVEGEFPVFPAEQVDGYATGGATPRAGFTPSKQTGDIIAAIIDQAIHSQDNNVNGATVSPLKRRVGRPPKHNSMLTGLGSPPAPRILPLPTHNPKERLNLPKPNYRAIQTFEAFERDSGVGVNYVDKPLANIGYQESENFFLPERTFIRGAEGSIEEELDFEMNRRLANNQAQNGAVIGRVEYDMDEQDERWLEAINVARKADGTEPIRPAMFEVVMTIIEKEWHALEKRIPKPSPKQPQTQRPRSGSAAAVNGEPAGAGEEQDTKCAICDDGDCENTNAIVFCDGCDLAVHQECYGVPFIPEGQWLCRKCQLIGRNTPTCIFCPNIDGAFKQTNTLRWSHLLCSLWIPEVTVANLTFMEPITDVEKVPKQRWKLTCYLCKQQMGACVQCANKTCFAAFHVTCARRGHLYLKMKNSHGSITEQGQYKGYCHRHVPSDWRKEQNTLKAAEEAQRFYKRTMKNKRWADSQQAALAPPVRDLNEPLDGADGDPNDPLSAAGNNKRKKMALQRKMWRLPGGAPIVPEIVYEHVEHTMGRLSLRKRKDFVAEACKYWSLKREARRGAPLIKRFQAQMENFTSMEMTRRNFAAMGAAGRLKLERRIQFAEDLEGDMAQIYAMCQKIKERETQKLEDARTLRQLIDNLYFPVVPLLWPILEKAQFYDSNNKYFFKNGLASLAAKLQQRAVVTTLDFAIELGKVFSEAIRSSDPGEVTQENGHGASTKNPTALLKDKRSRAKRTILNLKPLLQDVSRKEAELAKKDSDYEWKEIENVFAESTALPPIGTHASANGAQESDAEDDEDHPTSQRAPLTAVSANTTPNGILDPDGDIDMPDADTKPNGTLQNGTHNDPLPPPPALSYSGSTDPSGTHDPLTPPTHPGKDLLAPFREGGLAWYLEEFEPSGTTIHDPDAWEGRALMREMSEELSDMDDEEVEGLMGGAVGIAVGGVAGKDVGEEGLLKAAAARKRAKVRRKRLR